MFPRVVTIQKAGRTYQYLQVLESYRENGRSKQRVVANLGRLDQLGDKLDKLLASLRTYCQKPFVLPEEIEGECALAWGAVRLARHLWEQVNLPEILGRLCRSRPSFAVAETAFVLVANRLCEPCSEHGLARWLEHTFVCDAAGRRWKPDWLPTERITKRQRVKVQSRQLNQWYRTLDALLAAREKIEEALYLHVRDLFSLKVDLVFYDLTSTYFCRRRPKGWLRRHGVSKDGKPRQVQVLVGVVMANGWPIAHHVFAGNTAEKSTLPQVLRDVAERFGLERVMAVADRGLVSEDNLKFLADTQFRYLLGIPGRRSSEAAAVLGALRADKWVAVDKGNHVQEVRVGGQSARYFVIDSAERKAYEEAMRNQSMDRAKAALEKVAKAVEAGRLKDPAKIGARAGRALARHHGYRYYSWEVPGRGQFRFFEDPEKLQAERLHEGKYILKTDDAGITAVQAVAAYKELQTVESGFRDLKDVIDMRPIHHKTDKRVLGHLSVATLALFLKRTLEYQLAEKLPILSGTDALAAMKSIGVSELDLAGRPLRLTCGGGRDARRVVKALGIAPLGPPGSKDPA